MKIDWEFGEVKLTVDTQFMFGDIKSNPRGPLPLKQALIFCINFRRIDFNE